MIRRLLGGLTMRLMMVNKRLADMTGSAEARAARLFLTLAERLGTPHDGGVFIPLALSRQEIADPPMEGPVAGRCWGRPWKRPFAS